MNRKSAANWLGQIKVSRTNHVIIFHSVFESLNFILKYLNYHETYLHTLFTTNCGSRAS